MKKETNDTQDQARQLISIVEFDFEKVSKSLGREIHAITLGAALAIAWAWFPVCFFLCNRIEGIYIIPS